MYTTIPALYAIYLQSKNVTTDTRQCQAGALFFALKGANFDGNLFAHKALEAGCSHVVVDNPEVVKDERYLLVNDTLQALQDLAAHHRAQLTIPVLGITGTNGKTTTKELLLTVAQQKFRTLATEGNLNNHIGVPLTLLKINATHEFAIIEMGANHPYEIEALSKIAQPDYGIITNVGKAHLEGFGSFEGIIKTKTELYEWLQEHHGKAFVCADNAILMQHAATLPTILYASQAKAPVSGHIIAANPHIAVELTLGDTQIDIHTQLIGTYNLDNILAATAVGLHFGITPAQIKTALEAYEPQNKRSQLIRTDRNTLILDAYNANPTSMMAALANFETIDLPNKILILGDMRELGESSNEEHEKIVRWLEAHHFTQVYFVGEQFGRIASNYPSFTNTQELIAFLQNQPLCNATILIKGSRGIALEQTIDSL